MQGLAMYLNEWPPGAIKAVLAWLLEGPLRVIYGFLSMTGQPNLGFIQEVFMRRVHWIWRSVKRGVEAPCVLCIWVIMCRNNSDPIHVTFSSSLWLKCALLCLPGSLELGCSWKAPQCESPQVINLDISKKISIFSHILLNNIKLSYPLNR